MSHEFKYKQRNTHEEGKVLVSWKSRCHYWVFLFLEKILSCSESSSGWSCTIWGCCLAEVSSGDHFLCFNFIVGLRVHQYSSLFSLCPCTGETFLRRGTIGPAERNINTTKKITEHVTESYHIDSLIIINKCNDTLGTIFTRKMPLFYIVPLAKESVSNGIAWVCVIHHSNGSGRKRCVRKASGLSNRGLAEIGHIGKEQKNTRHWGHIQINPGCEDKVR